MSSSKKMINSTIFPKDMRKRSHLNIWSIFYTTNSALIMKNAFDFFHLHTEGNIFTCFSRSRLDSFSSSRRWVIAAFYLRKQPLKGKQSSEKKNIALLSCSIFREVIIICSSFLPALMQKEGSTNRKQKSYNILTLFYGYSDMMD